MKGCIIRRGDKSWLLKYDDGRHTDGRRRVRYCTVRGTKKDAQREMNRILHEIDQGTHVDPAKVTVGDYLKGWLKGLDVSAKTLERYSEIVTNHLVPALGSHPLSKLKPMHIKTAWSEALESGRKDGKGGLKAQTVLHHHRVLSKALRQAVKLEMLGRNPIDAVDAPTPLRPEIKVIDNAELAKLLRTAQTTRLYMPILLAATTGLRRGEVLGLRWKDIDLDGASVTVSQSLEQTKAGLQFKGPKTRRSRRRLTLPALTVEALRRHDKAQKEERLKVGLGHNKEALAFTTIDGDPINPRGFTKEFTRIVKRAKITAITFHGLRHSHITQLLQSNVHPKIASERAGHASVAITMDIYSHVLPNMQQEAVNLIDASLRLEIDKPA